MRNLFEIVFVLVLICANGLFSMSETAVVSSRKARLQQRATTGDAKARRALDLAEEPNVFLATVRRLAERVRDGAPAEEVRAVLRGLQTEGPLWKLRVNCLAYCRFVHAHHAIEDVHLFPILRRAEPALGPAVDRLEADHLRIAGHLGAVEAAAAGLDTEEETGRRERLVETLDGLAEHLVAHLAFEEEAIGPTLSRWDRLPTD